MEINLVEDLTKLGIDWLWTAEKLIKPYETHQYHILECLCVQLCSMVFKLECLLIALYSFLVMCFCLAHVLALPKGILGIL